MSQPPPDPPVPTPSGQHEIALWTEAIAHDPEDAEAYLHRGLAYRQLGQFEQALHDITQALRLIPNRAEAYLIRGLAHADLGQYQWAIHYYNHAIFLKPDFPEPFYKRALVFSIINDPTSALDSLRQAITLDPKYRAIAKTEPHFDNLRHLPAFIELVGE